MFPLWGRSCRPLDAERPKAEGVGGDAMIADAADGSLYGGGPLGLDVEMAVETGADARPLEAVNARARATVGVERWEMPEDEDGAVGSVAEADGMVEGGFQGGQLAIGESPGGLLGVVGRERRAPRPADDPIADLDGVAIDRDHSPSEDPPHRPRAVPPAIVVARREDLGPGESAQPLEVGLDLAVVAGRGEVAREQDDVVAADGIAPGALDPGGVVPPSPGVSIAAIGPAEGKVQVRNRPELAHAKNGPDCSPTKGFDRRSAPIVVVGPWPG